MKLKGFVSASLACLMMFSVCACQNADANETSSESNSVSHSQQAIKEYRVKFFDQEKLVSTLKISNLSQLVYPSVNQRITKDNLDYDFVGWDADGDGKKDEIERLSADLNFESIYAPSTEFEIFYKFNEEEKSLDVTNTSDFELEVPASTKESIFLYYEDEFGYPYTDNLGKRLKNVDIERSMTLTPKFLDSETKQLYYTNYPAKRVKGNELEALLEAIEKSEVTTFADDENHIQFAGNDYQKVVCKTRGNMFNDLTRAVQNETYYFRYTPTKWDVSKIEVIETDEEYEIKFCATTSEVLKTFTPNVMDYKTLIDDSPSIHIEVQRNTILEKNLELDIYFYLSMMISDVVISDGEDIVNAKKLANDYLIASSDIEISYEKGTMFAVNYAIDTPVNSIAVSDEIYVGDVNGEKKVVTKNNVYGQLNSYRIILKVGKNQ